MTIFLFTWGTPEFIGRPLLPQYISSPYHRGSIKPQSPCLFPPLISVSGSWVKNKNKTIKNIKLICGFPFLTSPHFIVPSENPSSCRHGNSNSTAPVIMDECTLSHIKFWSQLWLCLLNDMLVILPVKAMTIMRLQCKVSNLEMIRNLYSKKSFSKLFISNIKNKGVIDYKL